MHVLRFVCDFRTLGKCYAICSGVKSMLDTLLLLRDFLLRLEPCTCSQLCLNKCLTALSAQSFCLQSQLHSAGMFPCVHGCWRANRTRCRRYNIWMVSHSSPRASTARILLSNVYNSKPVFNFFIGITTALDAQSLAASLFQRTERNPVIAFELDARYGHPALGRWVSHFGGLDWQLVLRHIDFRYPQIFTCCVNHKEANIYDSSRRRISTLELPLLWRINSRAPIRAFVGISVPEGEVLPSPSLLSLGYVQPLMTLFQNPAFSFHGCRPIPPTQW